MAALRPSRQQRERGTNEKALGLRKCWCPGREEDEGREASVHGTDGMTIDLLLAVSYMRRPPWDLAWE